LTARKEGIRGKSREEKEVAFLLVRPSFTEHPQKHKNNPKPPPKKKNKKTPKKKKPPPKKTNRQKTNKKPRKRGYY